MSSLALPLAASPQSQALLDGIGEAVKEILLAKRPELVAAVNKILNVPILSEATEGKIIGAVLDALLDALDEVL